MGTHPARYSSVRQRVASRGCIAPQFFTSTPPKSAAPLMYRRLTPGMSALGSRLLLAKPPKIATTWVTAIQFSGSLSTMPPNKLVTLIAAESPRMPARRRSISTPPKMAVTLPPRKSSVVTFHFPRRRFVSHADHARHLAGARGDSQTLVCGGTRLGCPDSLLQEGGRLHFGRFAKLLHPDVAECQRGGAGERPPHTAMAKR